MTMTMAETRLMLAAYATNTGTDMKIMIGKYGFYKLADVARAAGVTHHAIQQRRHLMERSIKLGNNRLLPATLVDEWLATRGQSMPTE